MRPEPKFSVREAVMIVGTEYHNTEKSIISSTPEWIEKGELYINNGVPCCEAPYSGWVYCLTSILNGKVSEKCLRPIPKEKPNGICALEWIKDLRGVEA